jgi:carboxypeptidase Taq
MERIIYATSKYRMGKNMSLPDLLEHMKKSAALGQVAGIISWDQETMMPEKGAAQRAEQTGVLAALLHQMNTDKRIPEWIEAINEDALCDEDKANIREAKRSYDLATKVPEELAQTIAKASAEGQMIWAKAREAGDFEMFAPVLEKLVELKREEAQCLSSDGQSPYDALLDQFEPGARTETLLPLLEGMREPLVALRERISRHPKPNGFEGTYPTKNQLQLAHDIAKQMGYDFSAGRIDLSTHPFSSGGSGDSRITTRVDEADPLNCLYSTAHEVGHSLYGQGAPDPYLPAAQYCSMGVHESQSRFWENQIARSRPFAEWLYPQMKTQFPDMNINSPDEFYKAVNRVETGYIRTEADEVHYNLHVLLRFELERELVSGNLRVSDLEGEWNKRFMEYFGLEVRDVKLGVLQDVHWSVGLFGYFPTYSLGNIYSACLDEAMRQDMPDRDDKIAKGETGEVLEWLRNNIHQKGRLLSATELIEQASGKPASSAPLINYLEDKYSTLYNL